MNDALMALVEKWRRKANEWREFGKYTGEGACNECADELASVLPMQGSDQFEAMKRIADLANERADQAMRLLEQSTHGAVPDGWKLVPVEPTREMCDAFINEQDDHDDYGPREVIAADTWKAMLSAAPSHGGEVES